MSLEMHVERRSSATRRMTKISVLGVLSFIIMMVEFPIPFFPPFYQLDFSDLPAIIGGFAMGPVAGVAIQFVKNLLHLLFKNETGGVGELANFLTGSSFVFISAAIYHIRKSKKTALIGLICGTIGMAVFATICNYYVFLPLFAKVLRLPLDVIVSLGSAANGNIVDLKTFVIWATFPFNIMRGIILSVLTLTIYKRVSSILH